MSAAAKAKITVILANLGTPDAPDVPAVRQFLKQFLSDQRVIEIPKPLWQLILRLFILPFRPKRVAHAYAMVWNSDSPMREILLQQAEAVKAALTAQYPEFDLNVVPAMTYGNPGIGALLQQLAQDPQDHLILLPLFPQYSPLPPRRCTTQWPNGFRSSAICRACRLSATIISILYSFSRWRKACAIIRPRMGSRKSC